MLSLSSQQPPPPAFERLPFHAPSPSPNAPCPSISRVPFQEALTNMSVRKAAKRQLDDEDCTSNSKTRRKSSASFSVMGEHLDRHDAPCPLKRLRTSQTTMTQLQNGRRSLWEALEDLREQSQPDAVADSECDNSSSDVVLSLPKPKSSRRRKTLPANTESQDTLTQIVRGDRRVRRSLPLPRLQPNKSASREKRETKKRTRKSLEKTESQPTYTQFVGRRSEGEVLAADSEEEIEEIGDVDVGATDEELFVKQDAHELAVPPEVQDFFDGVAAEEDPPLTMRAQRKSPAVPLEVPESIDLSGESISLDPSGIAPSPNLAHSPELLPAQSKPTWSRKKPRTPEKRGPSSIPSSRSPPDTKPSASGVLFTASRFREFNRQFMEESSRSPLQERSLNVQRPESRGVDDSPLKFPALKSNSPAGLCEDDGAAKISEEEAAPGLTKPVHVQPMTGIKGLIETAEHSFPETSPCHHSIPCEKGRAGQVQTQTPPHEAAGHTADRGKDSECPKGDILPNRDGNAEHTNVQPPTAEPIVFSSPVKSSPGRKGAKETNTQRKVREFNKRFDLLEEERLETRKKRWIPDAAASITDPKIFPPTINHSRKAQVANEETQYPDFGQDTLRDLTAYEAESEESGRPLDDSAVEASAEHDLQTDDVLVPSSQQMATSHLSKGDSERHSLSDPASVCLKKDDARTRERGLLPTSTPTLAPVGSGAVKGDTQELASDQLLSETQAYLQQHPSSWGRPPMSSQRLARPPVPRPSQASTVDESHAAYSTEKQLSTFMPRPQPKSTEIRIVSSPPVADDSDSDSDYEPNEEEERLRELVPDSPPVSGQAPELTDHCSSPKLPEPKTPSVLRFLEKPLRMSDLLSDSFEQSIPPPPSWHFDDQEDDEL